MKKFILSASLVAGTSIGAGMIALPMILCKIGILPSIGLIITFWFFMYLSALLSLELNLRAGKGLSIGELGQFYRGSFFSCIGSLSLMFLS
ncbi:MAG: amino acid permease [Proteobacteria bacterium]|nr:amino acid permease [Pseudomonadota bacterium]